MCAALLAPNSHYVLTVGSEDDYAIKLWSLSGELIGALENKQNGHFDAALSADSRFAAVATGVGEVKLFEVTCRKDGAPTGLVKAMNVSRHTARVTSVAFAQDCVHLAVCSKDGGWSVWRTDVRYDLKQDPKLHAHGAAPGAPFERVALSPFATRLVGAAGSKLSIVDVSAAAAGGAALLETLESGHGRVTTLAFSSDGLRALSGGDDGKLRLWRVEADGKAGTV